MEKAPEKIYRLAFHQVGGFGERVLKRLVETFGSLAAAWEAPEAELQRLDWLGEKVFPLLAARRTLDPFRFWEEIEAKGIAVITKEEAGYPPLLREISAPPPLLYVQGEIGFCLEGKVVSIVGTRHATPYGRQVARRLARELAEAGVAVVSGLAQGIDSCAHRGALEGGGRTVAVLGSGLDFIYPRENTKLAAEIVAQGGALVSEFPLGTKPRPENFPRRNRIISGLAWGTVVVEAAAKSGALITAGFALDQGREVFAVPGPVTSPYSKGTHALLKDGARLVEEGSDILEAFGWERGEKREEEKKAALSAEEEKVISLLRAGPLQFEELVAQTGYPSPKLAILLTYLELKGFVAQLPGKYFVLRG